MTTETPALPELATIPYTELRALHLAAARGATRLFEAANAIMDKMTAIPAAQSYLPPYQALKAERDLFMAAGREQHQLCAEIRDAIDYREQI
jgi:hypothetical protein